MKRLLPLMLVMLALGCMKPLFCPECDDGNPCTLDYCNQTTYSCEHKPLDGPQETCSGSTACVKKLCENGLCSSRPEADCCGNGLCEQGENYLTCARDCKASCSDGIQNQGESGTDCGGPCIPCRSIKLDSLERLNAIRDRWVAQTEEYNSAIKRYNVDFKGDTLRVSTAKIRDNITALNLELESTETSPELASLKKMMSDTLDLYTRSLDNMIRFTNTREDAHRREANRLLEEALRKDNLFVEGYNNLISNYNQRIARCSNDVKDQNEDGVDCGLICGRPCTVSFNITKAVIIENSGYPTDITLNITPAAIEYRPYQQASQVRLAPQSNFLSKDANGNAYYVYRFKLGRFESKEFDITQTLNLLGGTDYTKSMSNDSGRNFLSVSNTERSTICPLATTLEEAGNSTATAINVFTWIRDHVAYEFNTEELGAEYPFINRKGACDEHSDLFAVMMRCDGIPARRVTGYIINGSEVNPHAWAEYYDDGWIYVDPTNKQGLQGFVTDQKHIVACVGEKAYDCSTSYSYSYAEGKRPEIKITEKTFTS